VLLPITEEPLKSFYWCKIFKLPAAVTEKSHIIRVSSLLFLASFAQTFPPSNTHSEKRSAFQLAHIAFKHKTFAPHKLLTSLIFHFEQVSLAINLSLSYFFVSSRQRIGLLLHNSAFVYFFTVRTYSSAWQQAIHAPRYGVRVPGQP
jgi:hypothetical protein